jgi:hypothetical protein
VSREASFSAIREKAQIRRSVILKPLFKELAVSTGRGAALLEHSTERVDEQRMRVLNASLSIPDFGKTAHLLAAAPVFQGMTELHEKRFGQCVIPAPEGCHSEFAISQIVVPVRPK